MVDFQKPATPPEPNYEDPITALNLSLSTSIDCWPELKADWAALAIDVRNFLRETAGKPIAEDNALTELLRSSVGNFILMKTAYLAMQEPDTDGLGDGVSKAESLFRNRSETKIAALNSYLEMAFANPSSGSSSELEMLRNITARIRNFHDGICKAFEHLTEQQSAKE